MDELVFPPQYGISAYCQKLIECEINDTNGHLFFEGYIYFDDENVDKIGYILYKCYYKLKFTNTEIIKDISTYNDDNEFGKVCFFKMALIKTQFDILEKQ